MNSLISVINELRSINTVAESDVIDLPQIIAIGSQVQCIFAKIIK